MTTSYHVLEEAFAIQGDAIRSSRAAAVSDDARAVHSAALALDAANDALLDAVRAHERVHPSGVIAEP